MGLQAISAVDKLCLVWHQQLNFGQGLCAWWWYTCTRSKMVDNYHFRINRKHCRLLCVWNNHEDTYIYCLGKGKKLWERETSYTITSRWFEVKGITKADLRTLRYSNSQLSSARCCSKHRYVSFRREHERRLKSFFRLALDVYRRKVQHKIDVHFEKWLNNFKTKFWL